MATIVSVVFTIFSSIDTFQALDQHIKNKGMVVKATSMDDSGIMVFVQEPQGVKTLFYRPSSGNDANEFGLQIQVTFDQASFDLVSVQRLLESVIPPALRGSKTKVLVVKTVPTYGLVNPYVNVPMTFEDVDPFHVIPEVARYIYA